MKFSVAMLVLLLSMVTLVMLSGCGNFLSSETFTISGTITSGGSPLSGVTVTLSGDGSGAVTTDSHGNYSFDVSNYSSYTITPSLAGYTFRPINRNATIYGLSGSGFSFSGFGSGAVSTTYHTVYLKSDGTVWTWGYNLNGQLGNGTSGPGTDSNTPAQVPGLSGVTAIAAGNNFTVALKNDGTVWTWGYNSNGQLGNGNTGTDSNIPVQVSVTSGLSSVIGVAAGYNHAVALMNSSGGTVWTWGSNSNGQLGNGTTTDSNIPVPVPGLANILTIAAGNAFTVAVRNDTLNSSVWAWGYNNVGQIGDGATADVWSPVEVSGMVGAGAIGIAAGDDHAVAMKTDGTVWTWGGNGYGQLGNGTTTGSVTPVQVSGMSGVEAVAAGVYDTVALKIDSTVWTWGHNPYGQLGNGTIIDSNIPVNAM
jgi:alpha-tubulin suppressor-like RCC1 family protein